MQSKKKNISTVTRRMTILKHLEKNGEVNIKELSESLGVSSVTIRNDLMRLENKNMLMRARGGALKAEAQYIDRDYSLSDKQKEHLAEKKQIAKCALQLIEEGDTIILDSGSTTFEIARNLDKFENLTVITNAIIIANSLASHKNINVIVPGGTLRRNSLSLIGMLAEKRLTNYFCDKLFLGVDGFDADFGMSTPSSEEAQLNQAMIENSRKVIVVADSSKFQRRAFAFIAGIQKVHTIITDNAITAEQRLKLSGMGIELIIAGA